MACSDTPPEVGDELTPVKLQLQWVTQAQFAGYFAAVDQGFYEDARARRRDRRRRRRHRPADRSWPTAPSTSPSPGCPRRSQSREQGAAITDIAQVVPALRHPPGVVGRRRHRVRGRPRGQEGRQLGLRQRVRAVRRPDRGRARPGDRRHARPAAVRHAGAAEPGDRRRPGHDLQRVRPGARGGEPRHRRALHARRLQRHQLERRGHGHAPGRHLGQHRAAGERHRSTSDTAVRFVAGLAPGLDVLPGQRRRVRRRRARRPARSSARATRRGR